MMKLQHSAIAFAAAVLVVAAPGGSVTTAAAQGSTLILNIAAAPSTLDPAWGCGLWDIGFAQNFYVRLTQYGEKDGPDGTKQFDPGNIVGYLAKSWTISGYHDEVAHVAMNVFTIGTEIDDRITYNLAQSVISHFSTAIGFEERYVARFELLRIEQD